MNPLPNIFSFSFFSSSVLSSILIPFTTPSHYHLPPFSPCHFAPQPFLLLGPFSFTPDSIPLHRRFTPLPNAPFIINLFTMCHLLSGYLLNEQHQLPSFCITVKKLYYSLTAGNLNNVFAVNPETGEIKVSGNLDYETRQHYTLTLTASDGAYTNTTTVQITVKDVNDNPPGRAIDVS